jgi:hypothetical protein
MEGTGSILKVNKEVLDSNQNMGSVRIYQKMIRFLSPREIANLHCFPNNFGKYFNNK